MSLNGKDVEEIMTLLEASHFDRLILEMDGLKLELARDGSKVRSSLPVPVSSTSTAPSPAPTPPVSSAGRGSEDGLVEVRSPLLGVFYRAPKPGEPPFIEVGDRVEEETVIGIIEVMKLMNSARAGVSGEVVEIVGTNGEMVEHGEVLVLVRPGG
ncbi:acetyl-CoA carboxylase, biotin carboxyl carrier protein [Altericroceibacterium spongiae]|uniref:Biotin carboxyl carrier protein of acetyl-CoA carboxylase n=1 Tax=Altericroceibacterium spongiae TaxID=2320269 RepID=A0A420ECG6_9SPHN|nr:biotin/lipoyl-containing protein [Altericroceibacterium spongiae]RKF18344.1 acetyl-CoA carboxylase, biotin carboxyl carrier protein [Altericroceibacterium spongiae]